MPAGQALQEWKNHWPLALAAAFGMTLSMLHVYSLGAFMAPMEEELKWSRAAIAGGLTISSLVGALLSPFMGILIDRLGCRRVALPGAALFLLSTCLLTFTTRSVWSWWGIWFLVSLTLSLVRPAVWTKAVSAVFHRGRGLALAAALSGTSIASLLGPVAATYLIEALGWRMAYVALALLWASFVLPMLYFFFDRADHKAGRDVASAPISKGYSLREALTSSHFYRLGFATIVIAVVVIGMTVHLIPLLTGKDMPKGEAAVIAGSVGVVSLIGRFATGAMLDRWNGPLIGAFSAVLPAMAALILLLCEATPLNAILAVCLLGFSLGAELDVIAYFTTRYFGLKNFGAIYGSIASLLAIGTGLGPLLAGLCFDMTGKYDFALMCVPVLCVVTAIMLGTLGAYPDFDREKATETP